LLKELGSIKAVKDATLEELQALKWLPNTVAAAVHEKIHGVSHHSRVPPGRNSTL
jgi:hypothetical protein